MPQIRAAMAAAQVDRALCICTTLEEFDRVHALATALRQLLVQRRRAPGQRRQCASRRVDDLIELQPLPQGGGASARPGSTTTASTGRSVAEMAWQRERFRVHIRAARATGMPLVIHTRSASVDTLAILREEERRQRRRRLPLLHRNRRGGAGRARPRLPHLVFRHPDLQECRTSCARWRAFVPLDRCLIETDSPYLAPVPFRGKGEHAGKCPVGRQAHWPQIKGDLTVEVIADSTSRTFERLFLGGSVPRTSGET